MFAPKISASRLPAPPLARAAIYGLLGCAMERLFTGLATVIRRGQGRRYGAGFQLAEFMSGSVLRRVASEAPWDYRHARFNIDGLVRLDYLPLWALVGLGTEQLDDRLMRRRPARAR
jgi:hypothetical protein